MRRLRRIGDVVNLFAVIVAAALAMACASRMKMYVNPEHVVQAARPEHPNVAWSIVEFDDQGLMFDSAQLDRALAKLRELARAKAGHLRLVVYVHGWKHDASEEDAEDKNGNLRQFPLLLEQFESDDADDQVFGLYMAWRGEALGRDEPVNRLFQPWITFFSRIRAAGRVARPSFTEALLSVLTAAELEFNADPLQPDRTTSVVIGHSMGGYIVEEALSKAMLGSLFAQLPAVNVSKKYHASLVADADLKAAAAATAARERSAALKHAKGISVAMSACRSLLLVPAAGASVENGSMRLSADLVGESLDDLVLSAEARASLAADGSVCEVVGAESTQVEDLLKRLQAIVARVRILSAASEVYPERGAPVVAFATLKSLEALVGQEEAKLRRWARLPGKRREVEISLRRVSQILDLVGYRLLEVEVKLLSERYSVARATGVALLERERALLEDAAVLRTKAGSLLVSWKPPADLVLLINPASRGIMARHMIGALKHIRSTFYAVNDPRLPWMLDSQRPWIISVSSDGDFANRRFFPIGVSFDSAGERFREDCELRHEVIARSSEISRTKTAAPCASRDETEAPIRMVAKGVKTTEKSLVRSTAPLNKVLRSHELATNWPLEADLDFAGAECKKHLFATNLGQESPLKENEITTCEHRYRLEEVDWSPETDGNDSPGRWNDSGYWVVHADRTLIKEHNDIFGFRTNALIAGLIRMSQAFSTRPVADAAEVQARTAKAGVQ